MSKIKYISTQDDWDNLLNIIHDGTLTPVIGQELFKYPEKNETQSLDSFLSKKLLENFGIKDYPASGLTDTVNYLLVEKKADSDNISEDIISYLDSAVKKIDFDFPLVRDLLEISGLKYFINTTVFYDILEKQVEKVRSEKEPGSKNFSPYTLFTFDQDLTRAEKTFVFNVFGSLQNDPAISDNDLLEFTGKLGEVISDIPNLMVVLQNNNILFLGCAYPKWLTRFVLRLLTTQTMNIWGTGKPRRKIYVVNDPTEFREDQDSILNNSNVISYQGTTAEFMAELSGQWRKKYQEPKSIFLSYTRGDKEAVENLKKGLEQIGNVKCWYDKEDLDLAVKWREEIITEINKADLFIPLISNNSLDHKGFVEKEWDAAWNTSILHRKNGEYLVPIVIDETDPYDKRVPEEFKKLNIGKLPQGVPDKSFQEKIMKILNLE